MIKSFHFINLCIDKSIYSGAFPKPYNPLSIIFDFGFSYHAYTPFIYSLLSFSSPIIGSINPSKIPIEAAFLFL